MLLTFFFPLGVLCTPRASSNVIIIHACSQGLNKTDFLKKYYDQNNLFIVKSIF